MNKKQTDLIEYFIELIIYTLEFKENSESEIYTIDKLVSDYEDLINKAQKNYKSLNINFKDALFPIIAWIDETILNSRNREKKLWRKHLLQKKLFNTSNAGHEFFETLDTIPPNKSDLKLLYLNCIFLGFRGKYYRQEDLKELDDLLKKQTAMIGNRILKDFPKIAFSDAYAKNPLPTHKKFKLPYTGLWIFMGISVIVGTLLFLTSQSYLNGLLNRYNIF